MGSFRTTLSKGPYERHPYADTDTTFHGPAMAPASSLPPYRGAAASDISRKAKRVRRRDSAHWASRFDRRTGVLCVGGTHGK